MSELQNICYHLFPTRWHNGIIGIPILKGVLYLEDKSFELLTRMYSEFSEFRKDITGKVDSNTKETQSNSKEIRITGNQVTRLEYELKNDIKTLFDGYKQTYEKLEALDTKVDGISDKLEKQEVEFKVFKGGK